LTAVNTHQLASLLSVSLKPARRTTSYTVHTSLQTIRQHSKSSNPCKCWTNRLSGRNV